MNYLISILLLLNYNIALSQLDSTYYFKEVGMTINVPPVFKQIDHAAYDKMKQRGGKLIKESNDNVIIEDGRLTKDLLTIRSDETNYLNITATPCKDLNKKKWELEHQNTKDAVYKTFVEKITAKNIDTVNTKVYIDGLEMNKFEMTLRINPVRTMKMISYVMLYKGYDFTIIYLSDNAETEKKFEGMIQNSKFQKGK